MFWVFVAQFSRSIFSIINYRESFNLNPLELATSSLYGLKLDFSLAGYATLLVSIFLAFEFLLGKKILRGSINIYSIILIIAVCIISMLDAQLYTFWGSKLSWNDMSFVRNPGDITASLNWFEIFYPIFSILALTLLFFRILIRWPFKFLASDNTSKFLSIPVFLIVGFNLLWPIRGGFNIRPIQLGLPIQVSSVYHNNESQFANHLAINPAWYFMQSFLEELKPEDSYSFYSDELAYKYTQALAPKGNHQFKLFSSEKPNIVLLILESFGSKAISKLGGEENITPNFDRICSEGLLFRNFYGSGSRSEKGLAALFSGFPSMPRRTLLARTDKTENFPMLYSELKEMGYHTEFHYGGEMEFGNFKSYFLSAGVDKIKSKWDFPIELHETKWGVHDEHLFNSLGKDFDKLNEPFFISFFSLSSHEPFDVPYKNNELLQTKDGLYKNSVNYTDKCLGDFVDDLKKSKYWENTLLIITADHGVRYIGNSANHSPEKFHIPLLFTGGAITVKDSVIDTYCDQKDFSYSLLYQLGLKNYSFSFSKDIFDPNTPSYAFYAFNEGFGLFNKDNRVIYNLNSKSFIVDEGQEREIFKRDSKAIMQNVGNVYMDL